MIGMTNKITYDDSLMREVNLRQHGVTDSQMKQIADKTQVIYDTVQTKLASGQLDFTALPKDISIEKSCKKIWGLYADKSKRLVVIGIGAADQAAKMFYKAFRNNSSNKVAVEFAGFYTDPDEIDRLVNFVKGFEKETTIIVLSKTGTTVEPFSTYLAMKSHFNSVLGSSWASHFLCVTDPNGGLLLKEAQTNNIHLIPTSKTGDRFAPLSSLGVLPSCILNLRVGELFKGANDMFAYCENSPSQANVAWRIALYQHLYQELYGISVFTVFTYISRLEEFNMWLRQLWGESLGKNDRGVLLFPAMGPKDQHSVLQMFNDGKWLSTFLFISQRNFDTNVILSDVTLEDTKHFDRKSFSFITQASLRNTELTFNNYNRPSASLEIEKLDEYTFGTLIALFEMVVVYLGALLSIENVFNQPGVTESREFIDASMNRAGSDAALQKLVSIESKIKRSSLSFPNGSGD
ncbi:hypothetical protein COY90_02480 [Candidatus Roizmanbacteria bacterium CG_4_10_14_0_8_um_filter_39_9]|uniref:Glucose-6-phosphate isomerase n=1 Tax=Candidatus Roizmanbacteria bacterium CG_4_10_14_0_8_um_filter_39_9 TaxID=1974829 RepID=A0A2M7QCZ7_9BACT|nr:MAG: hypothetical protein COY90_02480 [Candidatus Roizmanbacteria bacterium CG_4_10_14_0_8_um_filter_39_9]